MFNIFKIIFIIFIIFFSFLSDTFAYSLSKKDNKLLIKIYKIIDKKFSTKKSQKLFLKIKKIKPIFFINENKKKIRIYYLLDGIEKYLENKIGIGNMKKGGSSVGIGGSSKIKNKLFIKINDDNLPKKFESQNKKENSKRTKKIPTYKKNIIKIITKFNNNKVLKTTKKNGVFVKYIKIDKKRYIPKHTPKNLKPEIKTNYLIRKITDKNKIIIEYFKEYKLIEITGIENYICYSKKLNIYLKANIENKYIKLENIKKKNKKTLKGEFLLNGKEISKILIENKICVIKK